MKRPHFFSKLFFLFIAIAIAGSATAGDVWDIEPSHSIVGFKVRHMGVSAVAGQFDDFKGTVTLPGGDLTKMNTEATIQAASINTHNKKRDDHLRTGDFFDAKKFPTVAFKSKQLKKEGTITNVVGDLTMHGVTKEVSLELGGVTEPVKDPWGGIRRGMTLTGKINRKDFGLTWNKVLDNGGVVVSDNVDLNIELELLAKDENAEKKPTKSKGNKS